ncbi:MAG: 1-acyl-sn-glycerol-3-phosphate acyltransferase [Thermodesulfobacteriota bacterium]|nr:1-acyl-sn-glycerol-3-phosphate acyltransferase [Thermodesulfobacteriota bacterium]
MLMTAAIIVWIVLTTGIFGILAILASFVDLKGRLPHKVAGIWARSILAASPIEVTVTGLSNIDPAKSYVYMSNHQSNYDIPVLLGHLPVQFRWLAKIELFRIPLFGYAMKRAGYICIDRSNRESAFESLKKAAGIIRDGVSVMIFPEGTRSRDGNIGSFKKGGFVLAIESGVPILPVIIRGTFSVMPKSRLLIKPGKVTLEILKPVETTGFTRETKDALMEKIGNIMREHVEAEKKDIL